MKLTNIVTIAKLIGGFIGSGCHSSSKRVALLAPAGTNAAAAHHNDEGIRAYQQQQWESAKQHFEMAITASPELAEAHYNLGLVVYQLRATQEGDTHFITAANLAPGHKIIWDAPPLRNVALPEKETTVPAGDGHMHSH